MSPYRRFVRWLARREIAEVAAELARVKEQARIDYIRDLLKVAKLGLTQKQVREQFLRRLG